MSVRLYIGNLPFEVTGDDLNTLFSTIGVVEDAIIVTQPGGGRPRGFGFVEMEDEQILQKVQLFLITLIWFFSALDYAFITNIEDCSVFQLLTGITGSK